MRRGTLFSPLRHETAIDKTADKLLTAIALGEFGEGDQLPTERELVQHLQVARATIREAIGRLSRQGVIEVRRGRFGGTFVAQTLTPEISAAARRTIVDDWPQLEQLLDLRSLVEGMIAAAAADRLTAVSWQRITDTVAGHVAASTPREVRSSDRDFHIAVAAAARNPYLLKLRDDLAGSLSVNFGLEPYVDDPAVTRRAVGQHKELTAAILDRDSTRASQLAKQHFTVNVEAFDALRRRMTTD